MFQKTISFATKGRGTLEITDHIADFVNESRVERGICHLFILHTSASLIVCENADPSVRDDLETFMQNLVPEKGHRYTHNTEGEDDMPAHIRSILTQTSLTLPVSDYQLALGTWQGIYIWEHRYQSHQRKIIISIC